MEKKDKILEFLEQKKSSVELKRLRYGEKYMEAYLEEIEKEIKQRIQFLLNNK